MVERIEKLKYLEEQHDQNTFFDGPAEYLVNTIVEEIRKVPEFKLIFDESIDPYKRMDYSIRELPAIRVYNESGHKEFESWFETGDVIVDVIFPASLRRKEVQQLQDTLTAAVLQQFRRNDFFAAVRDAVPGLNELGKDLTYDKGLGFVWEGGEVPLTQVTVNFRVDLREWDLYLEDTFRTKDSPFKKTLENLRRIVTTIQGIKDDGSSDTTLSIDQK